MSDHPSEWIPALESAARRAGEKIMKIHAEGVEAEFKKDGSPVTEADRMAEEEILEALSSTAPQVPVVSEENAASHRISPPDRFFLVDPLDGTKEFIEGVPQFVVSIAIVENGEPILGVLYNPVTKDIFTAAKGEGAFLNDEPVHCVTKDSIGDMVILNSRSETRRGLWKPFADTFGELRAIGSVAYKLGLTAAGKADIFASLRPKNEWDICAGNCIINEAGGKLIDLHGNIRRYNQENTIIEPGLIAGEIGAVDKVMKIFKDSS